MRLKDVFTLLIIDRYLPDDLVSSTTGNGDDDQPGTFHFDSGAENNVSGLCSNNFLD